MKHWRTRLGLAAGVAALALAIPAFGQRAKQDSPESLLPPGFGDTPAPTPAPAPSPTPSATPAPGPASILPTSPSAPPPPVNGEAAAAEGEGVEELSDEELAALQEQLPKPIEIPNFARRPIDVVGPLTPAGWGFGMNAWGRMNGRFLSTLMRRVDAPLPSRWTSILLRRALLTRVPAPSRVNPVDWVAERAWLLLRMGEADAARMLVQAIDVDQFTPKMYQVAVQTGLATADPAALCPLVQGGSETSDEPVWKLSEAMCAGLRGDSAQASTLIDQARRRGGLDGIDVSLAEKIVGAGTNARRAVQVRWDDVDRLSSWRFGLASATGLQIPERLMSASASRVWAWQARAPMLPLADRLAAADRAAALGVFSNRSLIDIYSVMADITDPSELRDSTSERLRAAYSGTGADARMDAIRKLWDDAKTPDQKYARSILTAVAAAGVEPDTAVGDDVDDLVASMLSAGLDRRAARWLPVVEQMKGEAAERAWAMLAVASPDTISISSGRINGYDSGGRGAQLLVAALAGLGRISDSSADSLAQGLGFGLRAGNRWTETLALAARDREPATVALLAAAGMQTGSWEGVPPANLYRILVALRQVGLDYEARMIAAEAIARS